MYPALGIDVSKQSLAVAFKLDEQHLAPGSFANSSAGIAQLGRWLERQLVGCAQPLAICLEATGRYGEAVAEALVAAGYRVSIVPPHRMAAYGRSQGSLSKTDRSDAKLIALFCGRHDLPAWQPPTAQQQTRQELSRHLEDLKQSRQQVRSRLSAGVRTPSVQQRLQEQIDLLDQQITAVEEEMAALVHQDEQQRQQLALLTSIPGIGQLTALRFLAELAGRDTFATADQLAAYAGLVPKQHLSGSSVQGKPRLAKGGNAHLRTTFYMPALSAERFNPVIAALAARLRARSKPKMVIIGAIMHKLLRLAFGVLKSGRPFDPYYAQFALDT